MIIIVLTIILLLITVLILVFLIKSQISHYVMINKYNEIETPEPILQKYVKNGQKIIWIPNPGNGGDALIMQGTKDFFEKIGIQYKIGNNKSKYQNEVLLYSGGGNIVGIYKDGENFITNNIKNNTIIILPHTIKDVDNMIKMFKPTDIIITREKQSYNYVKNMIPYKKNVYLSKDMAFYINMEKMPVIKEGSGILNYFREDCEKKNTEPLPSDNKDLSKIINYDGSMSDVDKVFRTVYEILSEVNNYKIVTYENNDTSY